jgi:EAL domain
MTQNLNEILALVQKALALPDLPDSLLRGMPASLHDRVHPSIPSRETRPRTQPGSLHGDPVSGFALDDFGAGFGSFYYLKHIPFDYVKIDGEFIRNLPSSSTDQLILDSIVQMSKGLGKYTIAEFVGDSETVKLLKEHGVDYAQGYHLGKPRPVSEARTHRAE